MTKKIEFEMEPEYECKRHGPHNTHLQISDTNDVWSTYCLICLGSFMNQEFGTMTQVKNGD